MPFAPTYNMEPGSTLLQAYRTPFQGTWKTLPVHFLPPDVLFDSQNVRIHRGALRSRPGLVLTHDTDLLQPAVGSYLFLGSDVLKRPMVATTDDIWMLQNEALLRDAPGSEVWAPLALTGWNVTRDQPARFTSLEHTAQITTVVVSPGSVPYYKDEAAGTFVPIPDTFPRNPVDCCTVAGRILLLLPPFTVRWSNFLDPLTYQDGSINILADTEDKVVAIRNLGTLGFVVYKEGSRYIGLAQAGSDANAFRFEYYGVEIEGPCGPNALVSVQGSHMYLTPTGRVGVFDGSQHQWIADGLWTFLQQDLDKAYLQRVCGYYDYEQNAVVFFYPRKGEGGQVHGMILLDLPYPTAGITTLASFLGFTSIDVGTTLSIRLFANTTEPYVFGTPAVTLHGASRSYRAMPASLLDDTMPFSCSFQPGLLATPDSMIHKPYLEVQALRGEDRGLVDIYQVTSNLLETEGGTVEDFPTQLDLTTLAPAQFLGFTEAAAFLGFRVEWPSTANFAYYGADLYGRPTA